MLTQFLCEWVINVVHACLCVSFIDNLQGMLELKAVHLSVYSVVMVVGATL